MGTKWRSLFSKWDTMLTKFDYFPEFKTSKLNIKLFMTKLFSFTKTSNKNQKSQPKEKKHKTLHIVN